MIRKVAKCEICKKKFTGINAGKHTKETGHNKWELLKPKEKEMIKPKILSDEKVLKAQEDYIQRTYQQVGVTLELPLRGFRRDECLLQAALDDCYKEMARQIISSLNMRNVGGVEPEWAMSNKQYQALQEEA